MSTPSTYAGQRLGLPAQGSGAVATWRRRLAALAVDWIASMLVAALLTGGRAVTGDGAGSWLTLGVFLLEATLFTALMGGSFGQVALGIAVVHLDRRPLSLLVALARTVLICLVVPPLIYNPDKRGLHDLATSSITLRR